MLFKVSMKTFRCQLKMCEGVQSFLKTVLRVYEEKVSMPGKAFLARVLDSVLGTSTYPTPLSVTLRSGVQSLGPRAPFQGPWSLGSLLPGDLLPVLREPHTQKPSFCLFSPIIMFSGPLVRD